MLTDPHQYPTYQPLPTVYQYPTNLVRLFPVSLMAIYYFNASVISRSAGRAATASAAYRAAERIIDNRTGEIHDYTKKKGVDETLILAPHNAPDWVGDRSLLWNEVERVERRRNSQVAREIKLAIPVELNRTQQIELVKDFATEQFVSKGMVADVSFHELSSHNPHAHIMLTMREINEHGFSLKKNRDWNKRELLEKQREAWAVTANLALEKAGIDEAIDHRTLEAQGINRIPQIHLGSAVTAMMKRGVPTDKEERYREIELANRNIRKWEFHLELVDRMESIYKNSPELDPTNKTTQKQTVEPIQESQSISQTERVTSPQPLPPSRVSESISQPDNTPLEKPQEPQLESITRQQQEQVIKTASRFLHLIGQSVWNHEKSSYQIRTNEQNLLVIRAKDGRGEILRYQDGNILTQKLTLKDLDKFKKIDSILDEKVAEVQAEQQLQANRRRGRGLSL